MTALLRLVSRRIRHLEARRICRYHPAWQSARRRAAALKAHAQYMGELHDKAAAELAALRKELDGDREERYWRRRWEQDRTNLRRMENRLAELEERPLIGTDR